MKLSKALLIAASVAFISGAAQAQSGNNGISGDVSAALSQESWSGYHDIDASFMTLGGRMNAGFADNWAFQFDTKFHRGIGSDLEDLYDDNLYLSYGDIGAHVLYRQDGFQLGFMGGLANGSINGEEAYYNGVFGVEGQAYLGDATIWAQAARLTGYEEHPGNEELKFNVARGGLRYFLGEDTKIDVEGTYGIGEFDDNDAKITMWGAGVEHQFYTGDSAGFSLFARYEGSKFDYTDYSSTAKLDSHAVLAGFSIKFGGKSLRENDRTGANTDMINAGAFNIIDSTY